MRRQNRSEGHSDGASDWLPENGAVSEAFRDEVGELAGRVEDTYDDGRHLFLKATLSTTAGDVRPGDRVRGGVCLRTRGQDILVHPYMYRLVCSNGAIQARATQTRRISRRSPDGFIPTTETVLLQVREAIRLSAAPEAFERGLDTMRSATEREADMALMMLPHLIREQRGSHGVAGSMAAAILDHIEREFRRKEDRSLYGLMNAVTAVAREQREPETRWRLEELGGAIPALVESPRRVDPARSRRSRSGVVPV